MLQHDQIRKVTVLTRKFGAGKTHRPTLFACSLIYERGKYQQSVPFLTEMTLR